MAKVEQGLTVASHNLVYAITYIESKWEMRSRLSMIWVTTLITSDGKVIDGNELR